MALSALAPTLGERLIKLETEAQHRAAFSFSLRWVAPHHFLHARIGPSLVFRLAVALAIRPQQMAQPHHQRRKKEWHIAETMSADDYKQADAPNDNVLFDGSDSSSQLPRAKSAECST